MTGPVYLYSHGRRKHIADPNMPHNDDHGLAYTYCGQLHRTEEAVHSQLLRWSGTPRASIDREVARQKALPVCQRCQKAAAR